MDTSKTYGSRLKYVSVSGDGNHIWGVDTKNNIYYRNGVEEGKWNYMESGLKQIAVSGDGQHIWGVNISVYIIKK